MRIINKFIYVIDRPLIAFPAAAIVGGLAAVIDTIVGNIIEAIKWSII